VTKKSATIYDVAERAFVSIATVSRVLNGSAHVRPETRERVEEVVRQLQFVPSAVAQSLSGGSRHSIGLAYPLDSDRSESSRSRLDDASVLYTDAIIRGASWQASQVGYSLLSCAIEVGKDIQADPLQQLYAAVDGLILTDRVVNNIKSIRVAKRMNAVHLSGSGDEKFGGTIGVENGSAMRAMVAHLVEVHQYRDLGFVGGIVDSPDAVARLEAFFAAARAVGATVRPENVLLGDYSSARASTAISERLSSPEPLPRVFVCANDQMALGVVRSLRAHGHVVPFDVAVTGFDDILLAAQLEPRLTTIRQPSFELGVAAVKMVIALLEGTVPVGSRETLPTELVIRESCGCSDEIVRGVGTA